MKSEIGCNDKCGFSLEPTPEVVQPKVKPLEAEVEAEEEVAIDVVSVVSSVEAAEATEGKEEEAKKVIVSGTKMEVAPMKPEATEIEHAEVEVREEAPEGKLGGDGNGLLGCLNEARHSWCALSSSAAVCGKLLADNV